MRIYSWNVNGFRAIVKKNALQNFLKKENPDILCLSETRVAIDKIEKEKYSHLYFPEYYSYWNSSIDKEGYSGVAIFTKEKPLKSYYGFNKVEHDGEGRLITLEFEKFFLLSVYVPNAGEELKRLDYRMKLWDSNFYSYLKKLKKKNKNIIITGDMNCANEDIDVYDPRNKDKHPGFTPGERLNFKKLLMLGFKDTFRLLYPEKREFTFFAYRTFAKESNKGWRLDYFLVNDDKEIKDKIINSEILDCYTGSDHVPIKLTIEI